MGYVTVFAWSYAVFYNCRESLLFGKFLSNFFYILSEFLSFICFYFVIILLYTRSYENAKLDSRFLTLDPNIRENATTTPTIRAIYSMFRVSLNIMDTPFDEVSLVMMFLHVSFFLIVPCLFFNFIIGSTVGDLRIAGGAFHFVSSANCHVRGLVTQFQMPLCSL